MLGCPWVGELRQSERHVSPSEEGDCPLVNVTCKYGCGQVLKRAEEKEHEEDTCTKRPIELQLVTVQCRMERMLIDMKNAFQAEMEELKSAVAAQNKEMEKMKEEIVNLRKENEQFTTTIPVFSASILCIMPKLPSGNIPGVSYYPMDKFVKITASCEQELEARTHLFLAEYEKILPRLSKEEFKVNEHFPTDSLKSFVDLCNKKFTACYVSYKAVPSPTIELISNNASQFEIAKKMIVEKIKHKIYRMRFPGNMSQTLTLKCGNIKEEMVDVIVLFVGNPESSVSTSSLTSLFRLSPDTSVKPILLPSVTPGKAFLVKEPKHCAKNVIYISSMSLQTTRGYFGKEAYSTVSESLKEAFKMAASIEARSIAYPCEVTSGGMQSNYIIPAVIQVMLELYGNKEETDASKSDVMADVTLSDIRILIQDDKMDDDQLSSYFKYLALKYNLQ